MPNLEYVGAWTPLARGAKCEAGAGLSAAARVEGDRVFLRGAVKVKAGQELKTGETAFTLAAGVPRPPADVHPAAGLNVTAAGVGTAAAAVLEGAELSLEGLSYPLSE